MERGLIHLYTGDGKGKTTAALGLIMRAYGRGMRTVLAQFLKGSDTGELQVLKKFNDIKILRYSRDFGFFFTANEQVKQEMIRENNANLDEAISIANQGLCDLLVLDEVCAAYNNNALDKKNADEFILNKPQGLELVLTGRNAPKHFIEAADYVTEFVNHKHPYENGIAARIGIEY